MIKQALVLAFLFLPIGSVHAQHPLVLQKLNEWNNAAPAPNSDEFIEEIRKSSKKIYGSNEACAASSIAIEEVYPATADRYVFGALIRRQLRNAWTVTARLPGCDAAPVRFMVMQHNDKSLRTIRVNRGASYAHDSLIGDTLPLAVLAASSKMKREGISCDVGDDFNLGVTRIGSEEDGLGRNIFGVRYKGSWSEIWPINMCGRTVEVSVKFTADGDGGAYTNLKGDKVTLLPKH